LGNNRAPDQKGHTNDRGQEQPVVSDRSALIYRIAERARVEHSVKQSPHGQEKYCSDKKQAENRNQTAEPSRIAIDKL
jgi:hypothetical protein